MREAQSSEESEEDAGKEESDPDDLGTWQPTETLIDFSSAQDEASARRLILGDLRRRFRVVKGTHMADRTLDSTQQKAYRQLLHVHSDPPGLHNVHWERALGFFRLALSWEPSNVTAFAHSLQVRVFISPAFDRSILTLT